MAAGPPGHDSLAELNETARQWDYQAATYSFMQG